MRVRWVVVAAVLLWVGCGGTESESTPNGAAGSAGAAGDAGATGQAGADGGAGVTGSPADFETLGQCGQSRCGLSYAQLIEGYSRNVHEEPARCVLAALRDRTPGSYAHEASSYWSSGGAGTEHRLLVAADGSVLYAKHTYNGAIVGQPTTHAYSSAQRCALREPAFFQACIDAVDGTSQAQDDAAWTCLYGNGPRSSVPTELDWIQSCAAAEASCR